MAGGGEKYLTGKGPREPSRDILFFTCSLGLPARREKTVPATGGLLKNSPAHLFSALCLYKQRSREDMNRITAKDNPVTFEGNMDQPAPGRTLEPGKFRLFLFFSPVRAKTTMSRAGHRVFFYSHRRS